MWNSSPFPIPLPSKRPMQHTKYNPHTYICPFSISGCRSLCQSTSGHSSPPKLLLHLALQVLLTLISTMKGLIPYLVTQTWITLFLHSHHIGTVGP
ncbi:hypothetical protein BDZ94DRAFT_1274376 [Collybia nuda]|uniref:Uncharacterized protein n=1 Tax=Collybia nuda TaxID=64659 RepID=A0A9P6C952_9AGAR|nr:hypothetical protein BDZ94DRAFT_1274376 [Collybia nuda]